MSVFKHLAQALDFFFVSLLISLIENALLDYHLRVSTHETEVVLLHNAKHEKLAFRPSFHSVCLQYGRWQEQQEMFYNWGCLLQ